MTCPFVNDLTSDEVEILTHDLLTRAAVVGWRKTPAAWHIRNSSGVGTNKLLVWISDVFSGFMGIYA